MSTLKIEERITVAAPPGRVWKFLLDPGRVAGCLPGAKLDGTEGDRTFLGTMKVKVGPVLMEFKGKATMSEIVEAERRVVMTGTGNDKSGGGSAKMDMKSHIVALEDGGSEIVVVADVDLAGKLVRFGRGMMEGISKQLFKQFSERVRAELANEEEEEEEPSEAQPAASEEAPKAEAPAPAAVIEEPVKEAEPEASKAEPEAPKDEPKLANEPLDQAPAKDEALPKSEAAEPEKAPPEEAKSANVEAPEPEASAEGKDEAPPPAPVKKVAKKTAKKKPAPLAVKREDEALDAGSLVWSAMWAWIKGLWGRVFGKGK